MRLELNGTSFDVKDIETFSVTKTLDYLLGIFVFRSTILIAVGTILFLLFSGNFNYAQVHIEGIGTLERRSVKSMIIPLGIVICLYIFLSDWLRQYEAKLLIYTKSGRCIKSNPGYESDMQNAVETLSLETTHENFNNMCDRKKIENFRRDNILGYRIYRQIFVDILGVVGLTSLCYSFVSIYSEYLEQPRTTDILWVADIVIGFGVAFAIWYYVRRPHLHIWHVDEVVWRDGKIYRSRIKSDAKKIAESTYGNLTVRETKSVK